MSGNRHDKPKELWSKVDWDAEYQHRTMMFLLYEAILREQGRDKIPNADFLFESVDDKERYQDVKNLYEKFLEVHRDAVERLRKTPIK